MRLSSLRDNNWAPVPKKKHIPFSKTLGWLCNGDGEKAAFEKDGRSRGRPTPISPLVVSMVFPSSRLLIPPAKPDIRLYPA